MVQIRERCYAYLGSPAVYDHTVRTVYEREMKLNGGINYQAMVEKELAREWEKEKAQKLIKPGGFNDFTILPDDDLMTWRFLRSWRTVNGERAHDI